MKIAKIAKVYFKQIRKFEIGVRLNSELQYGKNVVLKNFYGKLVKLQQAIFISCPILY